MRVSKAKLLIALSVLLIVSVSSAAIVYASPPISGSGTFTFAPSSVNFVKVAGGNLFFERTGTGEYDGTFEGTYTFEESDIIQSKDLSIVLKGRIHFTGTIGGSAPGEIDFVYRGSGVIGGLISGTRTSLSGTGTGGLAGLHDRGTFDNANVGGVQNYTTRFHFGP